MATYETATTRQFYHGRTETVRSCTLQALDFARSLYDPTVKNVDLITKLKTAINQHLELMDRSKSGQGCDRHLFGLKIMAIENNIALPAIFKDPLFFRR